MAVTKLGRYDIVKPLGKGAMGLVYEAHDPNIDRHVAIKTIRVDQLSEDMAAEYESRFRSEARAAGRLQHPNIVGVYDAGRDQGMAFIVMELIRGGDLREQLEKGSRLSFERSMAIMRELLQALAFAHEQGIIHRDIKPGNVMLDANGRVKLCDFGVARITDSGEATRTQGSMVGTLKYMSPEQVQGLSVDARTDVFAAGVVLYQLLTGTKPFEGAHDFAIMQAIAQQEPIPPSTINLSLPPGMDAVISKALAKNRDNRYASARDFAIGLRAVVQQAASGGFNLGAAVAPPPPVAPVRAPEVTAPGIVGTAPGSGSRSGATSASAVAQEMELLYWKDIQDSIDPDDFDEFLKQFPGGVYAGLAQRRLRKLARVQSDTTGSHSVVAPAPEQAAASEPSKDAAVSRLAAAAAAASEETRIAPLTPASVAKAAKPEADAAVRQAEARRKAEDVARRQVEEARRKVEDARQAEQTRKADAARHVEEEAAAQKAQQAAERADALRLQDEARRQEDARRVEQARLAEAARVEEQARLAAEALRLKELHEREALEEESRKRELQDKEARQKEADKLEAARQAAEVEKAQRAESARKAAEVRRVEEEALQVEARRLQEVARLADARKAEELRREEQQREADEKRLADAQRKADEADKRDAAQAEEKSRALQAQEVEKAAVKRLAEAARLEAVAHDAELARQAEKERSAKEALAVEQRRKDDERRKVEERRKADEALAARRAQEALLQKQAMEADALRIARELEAVERLRKEKADQEARTLAQAMDARHALQAAQALASAAEKQAAEKKVVDKKAAEKLALDKQVEDAKRIEAQTAAKEAAHKQAAGKQAAEKLLAEERLRDETAKAAGAEGVKENKALPKAGGTPKADELAAPKTKERDRKEEATRLALQAEDRRRAEDAERAARARWLRTPPPPPVSPGVHGETSPALPEVDANAHSPAASRAGSEGAVSSAAVPTPTPVLDAKLGQQTGNRPVAKSSSPAIAGDAAARMAGVASFEATAKRQPGSPAAGVPPTAGAVAASSGSAAEGGLRAATSKTPASVVGTPATTLDDATVVSRSLGTVPSTAPQKAVSPVTTVSPAGKGRLVAIAAAVAVLAAGGAWFVSRDSGKPSPEPVPSGVQLPAAGPQSTVATPTEPVVPANTPRVASPAPGPTAGPVTPPLDTPALPADAAAPTAVMSPAQAKALERSNLPAAIKAYEQLAGGTDKKAAADAARRLWEIYRDGAKGLPLNAASAQTWYDRARRLGAQLPAWSPDKAASSAMQSVPAAAASPAPSPAATLPIPQSLPPAAAVVVAPPVPAPVPAPAPSPAPIPTPAPAPAAVATLAPTIAKTPAELFQEGQGLEGTNRRRALAVYEEAAAKGNGASQKRLWELLKDTPGQESKATRYQGDAFKQGVPGVPEPKKPVTF